MDVRPLKVCLVLGLFLSIVSNRLTSGLSLDKELPSSKDDRPTLSVSQKMCLEYSKWTRPQVAIGGLADYFPLSLQGEIVRCGISENSTQSGEAEFGEIPHMALIGYDRNGEKQYTCEGSLISEMHVLTAGYCTYEIANRSSTLYFVRLGGLQLKRTENAEIQLIWVAEAVTHPKFVAGEVYDDIGLLRLERPAKLSWYLRPICLDEGEPVNKRRLVTAGWGRDPESKKRSEILRKVKLVETPYAICKVPYDIKMQFGKTIRKGIDNDTMICATHPLGHKHDNICYGAGGGPLYITSVEPYCSYKLVGVVGSGGVCKRLQEVPTLFTRIAPYVSWIEAVVWPQNSTSLTGVSDST